MKKMGTLSEKTMPHIFTKVRGSTNGALYGDELWFIGHVVKYSKPRKYYHLFIVLDKNTLELKNYSKLFTFDTNVNVEFCLGLVVEDDRLIVSHSNEDRTSKIKVYDKTILKDIFM